MRVSRALELYVREYCSITNSYFVSRPPLRHMLQHSKKPAPTSSFLSQVIRNGAFRSAGKYFTVWMLSSMDFDR